MIANKWLAELYGVLSMKTAGQFDVKTDLVAKLEEALTEALTLQKDYHLNDSHLEFIFYRKVCKVNIYTYFY